MKTIVIKDNTEGFEIDIKRFYIHGSYEIDCPHCKTKIVDNYKEDYIFYPIIGSNFSRFVTCGYCDKEYEINVKLASISIELEVDDTNINETNYE